MVYTISTRSQTRKEQCKFNTVMKEICYLVDTLKDMCEDEGTDYIKNFRKLFTKEPYPWKKYMSKHEFYAWADEAWYDFPWYCEDPYPSGNRLDELLNTWCSNNRHKIMDDWVYVWDMD